ncbi:GDP-fucose protein O-fucosyltransferase [Dillenia turbinata]|uniref:O-fucosyltransferase family protein n=1 Tax=Dillenia turbinata TaxID=194707 RepID=A0AAN8YXJ8_9MAGN
METRTTLATIKLVILKMLRDTFSLYTPTHFSLSSSSQIMEKIKRREKNNNDNIINFSNNLNFFVCRRRRNHRCLVIPLLSALAGTMLFCFALIPFLAPPFPPAEPNDPRRLLRPTSLSEFENVGSSGDHKVVFRVPQNKGRLGQELWSSRMGRFYHGCSNASKNFTPAEIKTQPNRYLVIATSGGLNQQRTGITDAVVAAYILNATLVVPKLDQKSFWKDSSNFSEIFDVDWYISFLSKDVKIIKELPTNVNPHLTKAGTLYSIRVPRKCTADCYKTQVLPLLLKKQVVQLSKFDYRLSNRLEEDLQKLRCRVNYHALKFTNSIQEMGQKLVERMRIKSKHFLALHLRFETDMLAFSGCNYGGGKKESEELGAIRKRWKSLHIHNPEKERRQGKCPLTPEEVGLMLRALGFSSDIHIYVASGEIYGGEETLAPLKALFPNFYTKETIATMEELAPFSSFSSRMAALDYIVCDESDVFVTNNNGNMARMLSGRRKYFGHKPTIRPNAKKLYRVFMGRNNMTWEEIASRIRTHQIRFMGEPNEMKAGRGEFYENPAACICEDSARKTGEGPGYMLSNKNSNESNGELNNDPLTDDDEWDYIESEFDQQDKALPNRTDSDPTVKPEQPELEEIFSD